MPGSKSSKLKTHLKEQLDGEVRTDDQTLAAYATDKSIYQIKPLAVVTPASMEDLEKTISFSANEGIPISPRGGGSGTAGSALGNGIVIHFKQGGFLGKIVDFSTSNNHCSVTAEVGVYHETLQTYLKQRGYFLPADPSSARICQLGGNIATKASGPHALSHGSIADFLEHLDFVSARGEHIQTINSKTIPGRILERINTLGQTINNDQAALDKLQPRKEMKIASGYNLFAFLQNHEPGTLIARLLAGSVGTLGLVTRAVLRVEPYEPEKTALLVYFRSLVELGQAVMLVRETGATAIELISLETIRVLRQRLGDNPLLPDGAHLLFIEFEGQQGLGQLDRVQQLLSKQSYSFALPPVQATNDEELNALWKIRKQILPVLMRPGPAQQALSIVNDVGVDPIHLAPFIADLERVFAKLKVETILFGHAGNGNLHLRPLIDVTKPGLKKRIQIIADAVYEVVFRYQGTITAEHGMGRLRSPYMEREWGPEIYSHMQTLKSIFDPENIFNSEPMFSKSPITDHLRRDIGKT